MQKYLTVSCCLIALFLLTINDINADDIQLTEGLAIERLGRSGRTPIRIDPIEHQVVSGNWQIPAVSDTVTLGDEQAEWQAITANEEGWFRGRALRGGYVYLPIEIDEEATYLLNAQGHTIVYVNGEPHYGDPYSYGYSMIPVRLHEGANHLLFQCSRGSLNTKLLETTSPYQLNTRDLTLPDLHAGQTNTTQGALIVINNTEQVSDNLLLRVSPEYGTSTLNELPQLQPLSFRKVPFQIIANAPHDATSMQVNIQLIQEDQTLDVMDTADITLNVRQEGESYKETFISQIDGSLQYYAVQPAHPVGDEDKPLALFLSLHGASVEAINQANAYSNKRWGHIVAPTNRRPYGFDWEDWGRMDAMEVLGIAKEKFGIDPSQVYLTGHSMGGHGTWQVGVTYPDQFAAIGPSAGWRSFWTYASRNNDDEPASEMDQLLQRAAGSSDTIAMATNYLHHGVYILHGDDDRTVPVSEARAMRDLLNTYHNNVGYHEQPGAGHWWDESDEPGADTVDWQPMFDFFARQRIPANHEIRQVTFITMNPGVSASSHWVTVLNQQHDLEPSIVDIKFDHHKRRFSGKTSNIHRLKLDLNHINPGEPINIHIDETSIDNINWSQVNQLTLEQSEDGWYVVHEQSLKKKGPHRYGPFKDAFKNHFIFVYGTTGTDEETQWAYNKARLDAETFWYRGNGSVDIISDQEFSLEDHSDRDVILYGHSEMNTTWDTLLNDSPILVTRNQITLNDETTYKADDLATVFNYPRPDSDSASVGVIAGTGLNGLRLTDRFPYFVSGAHYPDWTIISSDYLKSGADGIQAAGFFDNNWQYDPDNSVIQK